MSRDLTSGLETATLNPVVRPILLVELDFPSGFVRVWSGYGELSWDGKTWQGVGTLGGVSAVEETDAMKATGVTFRLSGVPLEYVAIALGEHYQGRPAKLWFATLGDNGTITADPFLLFSGRMDVFEDEDSGETATLYLSAESRLIDLERPRERRFTDQDQKSLYPSDKGLEFVAGLQDKKINWGR